MRGAAQGEGHPEYGATLFRLAELYRAKGEHAAAEPLFRQSIEIYRAAMGEPQYAANLSEFANTPAVEMP